MKVIATVSKLKTRVLRTSGKGNYYKSAKVYRKTANKLVRDFSKYYKILKERTLVDDAIQFISYSSSLLRQQKEMNLFWEKLEEKDRVFLLWVLDHHLELPVPFNVDRSIFINFERLSTEEQLVSKGF